MTDWLTNLGVGAGAAIAGAYAMWRKVMSDRRDDKVTTLHDDAIQQVIITLRIEVERLSIRLAAVEDQNRKCEERNEEFGVEIDH